MFGKLKNGGEVKVHLKDNALNFEVTAAAPKAKKKKASAKKKADSKAK